MNEKFPGGADARKKLLEQERHIAVQRGKVIYCMLISSISKVRSFPARGGLKSTVTVVSVTLVIVPVIVVPSV